MTSSTGRLRPGDLVEVRTPAEILDTLDAQGTLGRLPFMPEMLDACGKRFRVARRAVKVCHTGPNWSPRSFAADDVVLLGDLRCSGAEHDRCQKACAILWREAWLRRIDRDTAKVADVHDVDAEDRRRLREQLQTSIGPDRYFCQASELLKATEPLSRVERYKACVTDIRAGNCGPLRMLGRVMLFAYWKAQKRLFGEPHRGTHKTTPSHPLGLQAGEWVDVKPVKEIIGTLNAKAQNRGLSFSPGMHLKCRERTRVVDRIDRIILDGTGEMRQLRDTVRLAGSVCECAYITVGGCSRHEISYWKEPWLNRVKASRNEGGGA